MYVMPKNLTLPSHIWLTQRQAWEQIKKGIGFSEFMVRFPQMVRFKNIFNIILIDLVMFNTII